MLCADIHLLDIREEGPAQGTPHHRKRRVWYILSNPMAAGMLIMLPGTMDHKPDRLNVHLGDDGTVNKVTHG
jgi:hypothetical protein